MKTFEAKFKKGGKGVFAISLVKDPATTEHFVAMSTESKLIKMAKVDEEQRIVMGLVLQPNQLIPRYNEETDEEYNIVFSEETIKDLSQNFFKSNSQSNSKLEHSESIEDITFVESWIVENSKVDKSANFGMNYPKGSWVATMKIDNDEIWNDYVKTGKVQGFSVDAFVDLQEINLKTEIKMNKKQKSILTMLKEIVAGAEATEVVAEEVVAVEMGSVKSGDLTIEFEGDNLEEGAAVFVMQDEEKVQLPDGTYSLEGDNEIEVKDGVVASMGASEEEVTEEPTEEPAGDEELAVEDEEVKEEELEEEPAQDEEAEFMIAVKQILDDAFSEYAESMGVQLSALKSQIEEVNGKNVELSSQVVELSKTPVADAIVSTPSQVKMSGLKGAIERHSK
tara:strand:- start:87 stop:1268 length:1182 start_codon:yes stop_codon:yes gene_type:complete